MTIGQLASLSVRAGIDPSSSEALVVVEHVEAAAPQGGKRTQIAERIEAFTDRRVFR